MDAKQKFALVTGATSGIGYELAKLLAKDGYNLFIVGREQQSLNAVAQEFEQNGIEVISFEKDLFNENAAFEVYDEVKAQEITIDILINDAGHGQYGEFVDTDIRKELQIIQLNIVSVVVLTKLFVKEMVRRGEGKILNLSSVASKSPGPWQSVYHGTKAFVQSFTEAVREEVKDSGVTITALLPGATDTDFFAKAGMLNAKNVVEGKLADPADVAKDGYDALMSGDDMVVSGLQNKWQVAMANVTPDSMLASQTAKKQEPVDSN
jgi:short-subunit dehydrogenase